VQVFLCTFHVIKKWLEQVRNKLINKDRASKANKLLQKIMYQKAAGSKEECLAVIDDAII
jgi:hypothetical protein